MENKDNVGASRLSEKLAAETKRADQLGYNCKWLIAKIDRIHVALCTDQNGTWQMRVEQAVEAAEKIKAANVEVRGCGAETEK